MNTFRLYFITACVLILAACDHGLKPPDDTPAIGSINGTIYYTNWPPADSIINLKLVVFKNYPPGDIISEILSGEAKTFPTELAEPLPYNVDSTEYELQLEARQYQYIAVAQQFGDNVLEDWRAVGQHDTTKQDALPTAATVIADSVLSGINVYVDFDSLPPQPF